MDMDLTGKVLIAMPAIGDERFERSVILICAHGEDYAMGLVLNKPMEGLTLPDMLEQLEVPTGIPLPPQLVLNGGPVGKDRGFVLHSRDRIWEDATMDISEQLCLTATRDVLHAIASEEPPNRSVLALGYAGWGPGQLEYEIAENAWLTADVTAGLVFGEDHDEKWAAALDSIGIPAGRLLGSAGRA